MLENISVSLTANIVWISLAVFILSLGKILFDIFRRRETRKMAAMGFRGALPKLINRSV